METMGAPLDHSVNVTDPEQSGLRFCAECDDYRPLAEFGVNRARKDGRGLYCRKHTREQVYKFLDNHPGYKAAQYRRSQQCKSARRRCARRGRSA
jgi:phage-related protein